MQTAKLKTDVAAFVGGGCATLSRSNSVATTPLFSRGQP